MSTEPTPPEDESSGNSNTQNILISSNDPTATKLCGVCSKVPAWFWTREIEKGEKISVELQPIKDMQTEAQRGCGLCQYICPYLEKYTDQATLLKQGTGKLWKCYYASDNVYKIWVQLEKTKQCGSILGQVYPHLASWRLRSLAAADENSDLILIQDWIDHCQLNHTRCNDIARDFLPTRLLDLEAFTRTSPIFADDIKLVRSNSAQIRKGGRMPRYIALSHCWGPPEKRPITTTQANLSTRMDRISFAGLPRTFQDAVVLTRKLGHRFLWIDSLCIIQDDENDWAREASTMAKVYAQSYCTLAALSSADSTAGLRKKTQTNPNMSMDISANDGHHGPFNIRFTSELYSWQNEYNGREERSPLRYRAWALQEKELSIRVILFGFNQLLWECCELKATAQVPWHHVLDGWLETDSWARDMERELAKSLPQSSILPRFYRMSARWVKTCVDYSHRSLTKETDKPIALSGIARSFQKYFPNDKYIAGMWSCHLPLALLWIPTVLGNRHITEYIAPSWSWISQPIKIGEYWFQIHNLSPFRRLNNTSGPADKWLDELEVVGIKGQPKHGDDYGALKEGATLELKGALLFELDSDLHFLELYAVKFCVNGVQAGMFFQDTPCTIHGKLICLGICLEYHGVKGLILEEHIHDGNLVYSRVGYVDSLEPSLWDGSERRQITLI